VGNDTRRTIRPSGRLTPSNCGSGELSAVQLSIARFGAVVTHSRLRAVSIATPNAAPTEESEKSRCTEPSLETAMTVRWWMLVT
jgi:hypothetical protein